jgi:hypothetical protein
VLLFWLSAVAAYLAAAGLVNLAGLVGRHMHACDLCIFCRQTASTCLENRAQLAVLPVPSGLELMLAVCVLPVEFGFSNSCTICAQSALRATAACSVWLPDAGMASHQLVAANPLVSALRAGRAVDMLVAGPAAAVVGTWLMFGQHDVPWSAYSHS